MSTNEKSGSGELSSFGGASVPASRLVSSLAPPGEISPAEIDRSCCVPLLALFGGAALWLVVGSVLGLIASIKFHAPDFLANCAWLTYGRLQPAADDALLYGFCLPAGLGVALWLLARLSQTPLRGAVVPIVAANLWHLGVLVGLAAILIGDSTGFAWLEFPRGGSVPIFFAYLLLALWAMMIFAGRRERALLSVAMVSGRRALLVPVDLLHGQSVSGRLAGARRGAGRHRLVVRQQFARRLDGPGRAGRGVLFPAKIHRSSVAKPLPRVVRDSGRSSFSPPGAASRRARRCPSGCRRSVLSPRRGCWCRCSPFSSSVWRTVRGFDNVQLEQHAVLLHRRGH